MTGDERQHAAFTLDSGPVPARRDLDRVNGPAGGPIDEVEDLKRPDEIELVDRRHGDDDDSPACREVTRAASGRGIHQSSHYRAVSAAYARHNDADGGFRRICVANRRVVLRY